MVCYIGSEVEKEAFFFLGFSFGELIRVGRFLIGILLGEVFRSVFFYLVNWF